MNGLDSAYRFFLYADDNAITDSRPNQGMIGSFCKALTCQKGIRINNIIPPS